MRKRSIFHFKKFGIVSCRLCSFHTLGSGCYVKVASKFCVAYILNTSLLEKMDSSCSARTLLAYKVFMCTNSFFSRFVVKNNYYCEPARKPEKKQFEFCRNEWPDISHEFHSVRFSSPIHVKTFCNFFSGDYVNAPKTKSNSIHTILTSNCVTSLLCRRSLRWKKTSSNEK